MKTGLLAAACAAGLVLGGSAAQALTIIDFEGETLGAQADGYAVTGFEELVFTTELGSGLALYSGTESDGVSLLAQNDTNGNFIRGTFTDGLHSFLSLTFGNDDPNFLTAGDQAVLTVFKAGTMVGQTILMLTGPNDLMDQTIGFQFAQFDSWSFAYTNAAGVPSTGGAGANVGLIEVIDNITYDTLATGVPEPAAWAMMILGFGGVGAMARQRRRLVAA
ncbi:MAG: PEPxxWA-CTERM sorting domain-containing protein [Phenylobacterium sp.]|uniref:PEPxxWA-CTERM sorting domain-containing protein n=1 Tax=Phenylobacterium sp. TaxID=1871053 RepID=UPI001A3B880E|nr:PEPxxWA-CTERM sorting domain-containing protein [Phenylobacterium sp.]MBL8556886.1 PEPxxWA-CTERM sorting domain-containing protein [Phenylobacterium sp.]